MPGKFTLLCKLFPSWAMLPLLALATLYFATRYSAASDLFARTSVIVASLTLMVLAAVRYMRSGRDFSRTLLAGCAAAWVITCAGRWLQIRPFSTWLEAIPACQVAIATVLFLLSYEKRQTSEFMPRSARVGLLALATIGPALVHAGNNMSFLPGMMLAPYVLLLVTFGFIAYLLVLVTAPAAVSRSELAVLAAGFTVSIIFLGTMRGMFRLDGSYLFDFFAFFVVVTWVVSAIAKLNYRIVLTSLAVFSAMQAVTIGATLMSDVLPKAASLGALLADEGVTGEPVDSPNVYVLVYDGIPEFETLEALGVDVTEHRRIFDDYDFKRYADTYSLASASLESMARTFAMREQLEWPADLNEKAADQRGAFYQRVRGGSSAVHQLFEQLGYFTYGILPAYLIGNSHHLGKLLPEGTLPYLELSATLLRGVLQGEFRSDTKGWRQRRLSRYSTKEKSHVIAEGHPKRFVDSHIYLPGHSPNSGHCRDNELEWWHARYLHALELMEQDFIAIEQHDPTAIVIAMSDHGPDLTGEYCTGLWTYELEDIDRLALLDRYSTMIAIRWPDRARARRYDSELMTNQDIFPTVFAYLYDSPKPLAWKVPREVSWKGHTFLRDGVFIPYPKKEASAQPGEEM